MVVKKLSLRENMSWNLVGSIIYSVTQWLLLIVIAKLGTPEMVGQYALGLAVTAPIVMLTDMELRLALVTDMKTSFHFGEYLGTRIVSVGLSLFIFISLVFIVKYSYYTSIIIILLGIAKLSESISDIFHGQLQKHERMDLTTISKILKGILTVIIFTIVLYVTGSIIWAIIGQIVIWTMVLLFFDYPVTKKYATVKASFNLHKIKRLVKLTIPLGLMALLTSFNTNIPSYLVEYYLGKEELGYFSAILYIYFAGNRLTNSLKQPAESRLAKLYGQKNTKGYLNLLFKLLTIGLFIGILGLLAAYLLGEFLLSIIYTPAYAVYSGLFVVIMVSGIFSNSAAFLDTGVIATRHFKIQPYLAAIWVVVSLIGCFLFIPKYGVLGAAFALVLSSFTKLLSLFIVLLIILKRDRVNTNWKSREIKEVTN